MLAALIQRKLPHYTIAQIMQVLDAMVVFVGASVFGITYALYALIAIFAMAKISDGIIEGMKFSKVAFIISDKSEELAERIDRSTQFISTIERGLAGPSLETVIHLCEVLGTSTEWILRGRALLPDSNLLAASVMEKLSGLSPAQLLLVDRMTSDLIKLLQMKESGDE